MTTNWSLRDITLCPFALEASKSINRLTHINPIVELKEIQEINKKLLSK